MPTPIENDEFASLQLARFLGSAPALAQAEVLQGCVVKSLVWSGGGQEVMVKASGQGISKAHAGRIDSITFASSGTTSVTLSVLDAAKLSPGMAMQCESEAVTVSTVDYTTGVTTFVRGAYSTSAAAHTAKPLYPYVPASLSYGGVSPSPRPTLRRFWAASARFVSSTGLSSSPPAWTCYPLKRRRSTARAPSRCATM